MENDKKTCFLKVFSRIICEKWTLLIIDALMPESKRFVDLEKILEGISTRTLAQRLQKLEDYKVITKKISQDNPGRVEYSLTKMGRDFTETIEAITSFGYKYFKDKMT